jgi:hypothetical protein
MKNKKGLFLLCVVCLLAIAILLLKQRQSTNSSEPSDNLAMGNATTSVPTTTSTQLMSNNSAQVVGANPQVSSQQKAAASSLSNAMQERIDQVQRPIIFYGKVVDEKDQPVEGARAELTWTQFYPEGTFTTNLLTDQSGSFSLQNGKGATLSVSIAKTGYYEIKSLNQTSFRYSVVGGAEPFHPDISNPVVFHLRKKSPGAALITSRHGMSPVMEFSIPGDGSNVHIDFLNRTVGNQGQMELSATKPPKTADRGPKAWSFRMSIPDGGFIEENDEFPLEAPTSGYAPTVEFNFSPDDANWRDAIGKHYYIEFGQPPKYGRIDIGTGIYRGVQLGYAINPTGSPDLEAAEAPPPQKQLPPGVTEIVPTTTH